MNNIGKYVNTVCVYIYEKNYENMRIYENIYENKWQDVESEKQNFMFTNWNSGSSSFIAYSYYSVITENGSSFKLCSY